MEAQVADVRHEPPTVKLTMSERQGVAFGLFDDPTTTDIDYGGGAGGGKSRVVGTWAVLECWKYPGIGIGIGRKQLIRLKQTTLQTILTEVHPALGIRPTDFHFNGQLHTLTYKNGSQIILVDLAYQPTDPKYERLGSLNLTHTIIEEAGELDEVACSTFSSRKNRRLNKEYRLVGKTIITCNPSQNFLRDHYDQFEELGGGIMQRWPNGEVQLPTGEVVTSYMAFVKSLPTDNPFLPKNYILSLDKLPEEERKRLKEGDWDYDSNDKALLKIKAIQGAIGKPPELREKDERPTRYGACDVAREGKDKNVFAAVDKFIQDYTKDDLPELNDGKSIRIVTHYLADMYEPIINKADDAAILNEVADSYIRYCMDKGIGSEHATVDATGLGSGVVDNCRRAGFYVQSFKGGTPSEKLHDDKRPMYNNIRSESYWEFKLKVETFLPPMDELVRRANNGDDSMLTVHRVVLAEDLPFYNNLKKDLLAHNRDFDDRQVIIESKKKMKLRLGRSPDHSDAATMAVWLSDSGGASLDFFFG